MFRARSPQLVGGAEKGRGIQVALHREALELGDRPLQIQGPVQAQSLDVQGPDHVQERRAALEEVDARHAGRGQMVHDAAHPRQHDLLVVRRRHDAAPGVEELHGVHARLDLHGQVVADLVGQLVQQGAEQIGPAVEHGLQVLEIPGTAALDQVGRQGERRAGESDQRRPVAQLLFDELDGLGDEGRALAGVVGLQPGDVPVRTQRDARAPDRRRES